MESFSEHAAYIHDCRKIVHISPKKLLQKAKSYKLLSCFSTGTATVDDGLGKCQCIGASVCSGQKVATHCIHKNKGWMNSEAQQGLLIHSCSELQHPPKNNVFCSSSCNEKLNNSGIFRRNIYYKIGKI